MKKRVLVTGSKGLIGSQFFKMFKEGPFDLISGDLKDGFDILSPKTFRSVLGDQKIDTVVHLAAFTDVSEAHRQNSRDSKCFRLNVTGTENIVALANELGAHLIHASTDFVFDGEQDSPIDENTEPNPIEWYGTTKLMAEGIVKDSAHRWSMLRLAFPFLRREGTRPDLVNTIIRKIREKEPLTLFEDQKITPTYANDVCEAITRFVENQPMKEIFHVAGPEAMSPFELGHQIADSLQLTANITGTSIIDYLKKDPRPRQQFLSIDTTKYRSFCDENGYSPPLSVGDVFGENSELIT